MSRRRAARPAAKIQLFTFLDVLTCTVGCLVLILALFARQGMNAARKAEQDPSTGPTIAQDRAGLEWQLAKLKESRDQTEAQLAASRLELSHVEDHLRRLREQHQRLTAAEREMTQVDQRDTKQLEATAAELATLKQQVADAQQNMDAAEQAARHRAVSYSVIPYDGPNQTRRRPIYIECRGDTVILQPEGVVLSEHDFEGPMGPGNPLAAALRAAREYLVARQPTDVAGREDPYPMLLVRPDGTDSYYAARTALNSWASEFGYELVDEDWKLKYPPPDPQLTELLQRVVAEARQRQEQLHQAMPGYLAGGDRMVYRASPNGGFVKEVIPGGHGPGGYAPHGNGRSRFAGSRAGRGGGRSGGGGADGDDQFAQGGGAPGGNRNVDSRDGSGNGTGGLGGNGTTGGRYSNGLTGSAGGLTGGPTAGFEGNATGGSLAGATGISSAARGTGATNGSNAGSPSGSENGATSDSVSASAAGSGPGAIARSSLGSKYASTSGSPGSSAADSIDGSAADPTTSWAPASANGGPNRKAGSDTESATGSASGSSNGSMTGSAGMAGGQTQATGSSDNASGQPSTSITLGGPQQKSQHRGGRSKGRSRDWGLPDANHRAVPVTRPVLIECDVNRLVILSEDGRYAEKEVRLGPRTDDSIDEFVSGVWQHMKGWGMAGNGLYWKPILTVDVRPGSASRYEELKTLLEDSGLEVHQRQPQQASRANSVPTQR